MKGDKTALLSREGKVKSYLIELDKDHYRWCSDGETPYGVSYEREDENEIRFLDPDGGPLFGIGYVIDGRTVVRIRRDEGKYIVTIK